MTAKAWAYAAATWAVVFALQSLYWAAGGTIGASTVGPAIADPVLDRDPAWVAALWGISMAKLAAAALPLALVQPWGRRVPRRVVARTTLIVGVLVALYGAANLVDHALMVSDMKQTPDGLGETAARWHLFFWDPWWLLGGVLFVGAARTAVTAVVRPRRP